MRLVLAFMCAAALLVVTAAIAFDDSASSADAPSLLSRIARSNVGKVKSPMSGHSTPTTAAPKKTVESSAKTAQKTGDCAGKGANASTAAYEEVANASFDNYNKASKSMSPPADR